MRWILAMSLLLGGVISAGCGSDDRRDDRRDDVMPMSGAGDAMDEKYNQADPVCGVRVNPRSAVTEEYGGQTWYFHNDECRQRFHDNPTGYLPRDWDRDRDVTRTDRDRNEMYSDRKDPVCGMNVDPKTAKFKDEYDGKTYHFCSKDCWQKFHDNPHAYLPGGDDRRNVR